MSDQPTAFPEFTDNAIAVLNRRYLRRDPALPIRRHPIR